MTRRDARERSAAKRRALRSELGRSSDLLHFLRLMAGASPELAGLAFMCDGAVDTNGWDRGLAANANPTDGSEARVQPAASAARTLADHPPVEVHIVRLPLVPTRRL